MRKQRNYLIITIIYLLLLSSSSCTPVRRPLPQTPPQDRLPIPSPSPQLVPAPNPNAHPTGNEEIDRLELAVEQIIGVERASVIVMNNAVLCGVKMAGGTAANRAKTIKQDVEKVIREVKPNTSTVTVAAEEDLLPKINRLAQEIKGGKPVSGLTEEINKIITRLNPKAKQ